MKNICLLLMTCISINAFAQWNTNVNGIHYSNFVGIGKTLPNSLLDIHGNSANTTNLTLSANYANKYRWRFKTIDRGNAIDLDITSSDNEDIEESVLKLTRSNSGRPAFQLMENWLVVNNGYVGIGKTTPDAQLDIHGNSTNSTNLILSANYNDRHRWRFKTVDRGNAIDLDITSSNSNDTQESVLKLTRSNSGRPEFQLMENWLVVNNGYVGIGTTTIDEKLTVNGKIKSEEVKVMVDVPADYVFDDDYNLPSLHDVESYISVNKHLPGIPSATTLKENGWQVGEMSNRMLEKIEELTLYMIELKKENEKLNKKNEELEKRVNEIKEQLKNHKMAY